MMFRSGHINICTVAFEEITAERAEPLMAFLDDAMHTKGLRKSGKFHSGLLKNNAINLHRRTTINSFLTNVPTHHVFEWYHGSKLSV